VADQDNALPANTPGNKPKKPRKRAFTWNFRPNCLDGKGDFTKEERVVMCKDIKQFLMEMEDCSTLCLLDCWLPGQQEIARRVQA